MASIAGITLSNDTTVWTDEFDWTPIAQTAETDITGGLVIEYAHTDNGRPMTLKVGWVSRTTLTALEALRDAATQPLLPVTLPDGRTFDALFRHHEGPPLDVSPVVERPEYGGDDRFDIGINLMIVV